MELAFVSSSDMSEVISNVGETKSQPLHIFLGTCATTDSNHLADQVSQALRICWTKYRNLVLKYRVPLELADEAIDRLLFWMPYHEGDGNGPPWREMIYGILSLNRLSMHSAQEQSIENSYGTSVRVSNQPDIPATSIRIALSVINCLLPSVLEMVQTMNSSSRIEKQTKADCHQRRPPPRRFGQQSDVVKCRQQRKQQEMKNRVSSRSVLHVSTCNIRVQKWSPVNS